MHTLFEDMIHGMRPITTHTTDIVKTKLTSGSVTSVRWNARRDTPMHMDAKRPESSTDLVVYNTQSSMDVVVYDPKRSEASMDSSMVVAPRLHALLNEHINYLINSTGPVAERHFMHDSLDTLIF